MTSSTMTPAMWRMPHNDLGAAARSALLRLAPKQRRALLAEFAEPAPTP